MAKLILTVLGFMALAAGALVAEGAEGRDADGLWLPSVARAESLLDIVTRRGTIETAEREAVLEQLRRGAESVRSSALAAISADSLRAGPLTTPPPPWRPPSQWGNRFVRATSITSVALGLTGIVASFYDVDPRTRSTIGLVAGTIGSVGALFNLLRPRPTPPPAVDPNERVRTLSREMLLADTFSENEKALSEVAAELEAIRSTVVTSDSQTVLLARRYVGALARVGALLDVQLPHSATIARQSSAYPSFSTSARGRLAALADHQDAVAEAWRSQRWLVTRSERVALDCLRILDRR